MNEVAFFAVVGCGFSLVLALFLGFFAVLRYLRYKEVMALAEKGLVHPGQAGNGSGTLHWGIGITALGMALCLGLYPIGWVADVGFPLKFGPWMLVGLIPTFFGLALVAIHYLGKARAESGSPPAGVLEPVFPEDDVVETIDAETAQEPDEEAA